MEYNKNVRKKIFTRTILVFLFVLITIKIAYAVSLGKDFGGRIIKTTATKVQSLENSGWACVVPGTSIDIRPIKGPVSYLIPAFVRSKTNTTPASGQQIIGKYSGKTPIVCTRACPPAVCTTTVTLDTITLFGTSQSSGFGGGNFGGGGSGGNY